MGCGRGARLGAHPCRSGCLTVNLPEARGLSPGHGRPLSESQMSRAPRVSQAQSREGTSTWASTLPRPAPSPLPCPAGVSEDPLSQQSCLACTLPLPLCGAPGLDLSYQGSAGCELDLAPVPCCAKHSPGQRCEGLSLRPSQHFLLRVTCPWLTSVTGSSLAAHRPLE